MVVGPRGYGKTYAAKHYALKQWVTKKKQFIYIRRTESELELVKDSLFADINRDNPNTEEYIKCKGNTYLMDDETCGYAFALSTSSKIKSASFPYVTTIIFDEFIINTQAGDRYLKNEVKRFLDLLETIIRIRDDVRVIMLSNSLSIINPYTLYWNLTLKEGQKIAKTPDKLVMLELADADDEYKEAKKNTKFGSLIRDSEFSKMSIDNEFILDSNEFIEKRSPSSNYIFTLSHNRILIGVWYDYKEGIYYCTEKVNLGCPLQFASTFSDHTPNTTLLRGKGNSLMKRLEIALNNGRVRFDSLKIKSVVLEVMRICA